MNKFEVAEKFKHNDRECVIVEYYLCSITPSKGLHPSVKYQSLQEAQEKRDNLQANTSKKPTELRWCIRPVNDPEVLEALEKIWGRPVNPETGEPAQDYFTHSGRSRYE